MLSMPSIDLLVIKSQATQFFTMLHLVPVRRLIEVAAALIGFAVLAAVYAGVVGTGDALNDVKWILRWSPIAAFAITLIPYAAWRWIPPVQRLIFPYLGGDWTGELDFSGPNGTGTRDVKLTVNHSFLKIDLILDSAESTSRTLVVHPDRDKGINRDRLYYAYLNERKEGVAGAGDRYRGLAVLRIETAAGLAFYGDYFTERSGTGKLRLKLINPHPLWAIWK